MGEGENLVTEDSMFDTVLFAPSDFTCKSCLLQQELGIEESIIINFIRLLIKLQSIKENKQIRNIFL